MQHLGPITLRIEMNFRQIEIVFNDAFGSKFVVHYETFPNASEMFSLEPVL